MKKQFFLLSLLIATVSPVFASCPTKCDTSCATDTCSSSACVPEHGHTFMSLAPEFQAATPERVSLFESNRLKHLKHNDKHGEMQVVLFGGRNTHGSKAAGYFLPYGHTSLKFDGSTKPAVFGAVLAESDVQLVGTGLAATQEISVGYSDLTFTTAATTIATDPATYKFDRNKDTSIVLPWNFGITYAALYEPLGVSNSGDSNYIGSGLVTAPKFKSTINPCLRRWHIGAGMELVYHFSDEVDGWYGKISTAVQHVRSRINVNESNITEKDKLDDATFDGANIDIFGGTAASVEAAFQNANTNLFAQTATTPAEATAGKSVVGSIAQAYLGYDPATKLYRDTGFPTNQAGAKKSAPANVAEAFNQSAWNYGKMGCDNRITRLADIELSIGRLWSCGDCASTSWELGVVIPTGNKPTAEFVAPAVVGNNQHAGIRTGGTTTVMLSENDDSSTWFRIDADARYLFRNTQKRLFDLKGNEWSRYMMVWANKDAYSSAVAAYINAYSGAQPFTSFLPQRGYEFGVNVFNSDFYVKPQFQGRLNQAVVMSGERFKAELGWNVNVRSKECVELACAWDAKPAFADSSYVAGLGLNNHRTIYNDAQTSVVNAATTLDRGYTLGNVNLTPVSVAGQNPVVAVIAADAITTNLVSQYDNFAITDADINYDSVATPAIIAHKPYVALGYAFDYDCMPELSIGASYEFTANNRALNQWMVWGKFEFAF